MGVEPAAGAVPRKRGRPKGSTNRRAAGLKALIEVRYGGSAAEQAARLCLVSPRELKAAGGDMARALVEKAKALAAHVREAEGDRDAWLRTVVREELADLAAAMPEAEAKDLRKAVSGFIERVRAATSGFGLAQALELITKERANLMPYTDQRQPLAVEIDTNAPPATFVLVPEGPSPMAGGGQEIDLAASEWAEPASLFDAAKGEVTPMKSPDGA